jgi:hypothetical protein
MTLIWVRKNALRIQNKAFHIDIKYVRKVCASLLKQSILLALLKHPFLLSTKMPISFSLSLSFSFTYLHVRDGDVDSHLSRLHIHVFCFLILSMSSKKCSLKHDENVSTFEKELLVPEVTEKTKRRHTHTKVPSINQVSGTSWKGENSRCSSRKLFLLSQHTSLLFILNQYKNKWQCLTQSIELPVYDTRKLKQDNILPPYAT